MLCAFAIVKAAWLSDDAYITLRVVDNLWHGYGLRWNILERVQAYTHPLWMLLLAGAYGVTREAYFTTLAVSFACVALTIAVVIRRLPAPSASLTLLLLVASRAFVEYSTSGLENPLSHFLLVLFWLEALPAEATPVEPADPPGAIRRPTRFCLLAALCLLTRVDLAPLVAPRVLAWLWSRPPRALRSLAWGALPLIAWFAFATIYYGTPLPNTALAKLNTGVPSAVLVQQGSYYLLESLTHDPVTLYTMIAACLWAFVRRDVGSIALAAGLLLQTALILRVGGDFMSGRFLSAPFVCAALFLGQQWGPRLARRPLAAGGAAVAMMAISISVPESPLRVWTPEPLVPEMFALPQYHGIIDERRFYFPFTGLWAVVAEGRHPSEQPWSAAGVQVHGTVGVMVYDSVGLLGYHAGPSLHLIDRVALADPLLARQPALPGWRIGHFARTVPRGYEESILACQRHVFPDKVVGPTTESCLAWPIDTNRLADPALAREYELLRQVTQAPLFSADRLRAIVRLNLGFKTA